MPERLRLSRQKGFRLPLGAKSVARPSKWGNPYAVVPSKMLLGRWNVVSKDGNVLATFRDEPTATRVAVDRFRDRLNVAWERGGAAWWEFYLEPLEGLDLACWCPLPEPGQPDICHARVLLDLVAGGSDA